MTAPHLILVTPEPKFESFHDWLSSDKGMDKVHPLSGRDELLRQRLGLPNYNKRCFAHVDAKGDVLSVIYTFWSKAKVTTKPYQVLPGKIAPILEAHSAPLTEDADIITFYSISSFVKGTGRPLIRSIYEEFTRVSQPPILTTLSPLRTLREWMEDNQLELAGTEEAKLKTVTDYLRTNHNEVQKFHLGNGAQVGAIHFNACAKGTKDDSLGARVMVSYRYPRDPKRLEENKAQYKGGIIPSSYHLQEFFVS
jgi:hypothetical protein